MTRLRATLMVVSCLMASCAAASDDAAAQRPRRAGAPAQQPAAAAVREADGFPGRDLGEKINAADRSLGAAAGEIRVRGGGVISTQVVLNSGHTLRFYAGTYRLQTELQDEGAIMLKSRTSVLGEGWDKTIIVEPPRVGWIVFQAHDSFRSTPTHTGLDTDISVSGLQILGANPRTEGGIRQTVGLGNCHRCRVEDVWFNGTGVIGVQAGGSALAGNFADDVSIRRNLFTHVGSQAAAVVNGRNIVIDDNRFMQTGRLSTRPGSSPIDVEPNTHLDIAQNIRITNNFIDSRGSGYIHGNGIIVQNAAATSNFGPVLVEGNNVIGGNFVPAEGGWIASGIYLINVQNVRVVNNIVHRVSHSGIRLHGSSGCYVARNKLVSTGTGGIPSFELLNSRGNQIIDNSIDVHPNSPLGSIVIQELDAVSRDNVYRGNSVGGRGPLQPTPFQPKGD